MSKEKQPKIERRFFQSAVEERAAMAGEGFDFGGLASRTGVEYELWAYGDNVWTEEIAANAFDDVLGDDVRVLFNHKDSHILGRTKSGTAKVWKDGDGLRYAWKNEPQITYANDLAISIRRGDVDQSSFGFTSADEHSDYRTYTRADGKRVHKRLINKIDTLFDVSPVTYPANPNTEAAEARDLISMYEAGEQRCNQRPPADEVEGLDIYHKMAELNANRRSMML